MNTSAIRPIETRYKGYRFRSRLEARWAVFFDAMGVRWEYEEQGYAIDGVPYLPDFVLRTPNVLRADLQRQVFVEIKPEQWFDEDGRDEYRKMLSRLSELTGCDVLVLIGAPGSRWWPHAVPDRDGEGGQFVEDHTGGGFIVSPHMNEPIKTVQIAECRGCGAFAYATHWMDYAVPFCGPDRFYCDSDRYPIVGARTKAATAASRAARFEHGERP